MEDEKLSVSEIEEIIRKFEKLSADEMIEAIKKESIALIEGENEYPEDEGAITMKTIEREHKQNKQELKRLGEKETKKRLAFEYRMGVELENENVVRPLIVDYN